MSLEAMTSQVRTCGELNPFSDELAKFTNAAQGQVQYKVIYITLSFFSRSDLSEIWQDARKTIEVFVRARLTRHDRSNGSVVSWTPENSEECAFPRSRCGEMPN